MGKFDASDLIFFSVCDGSAGSWESERAGTILIGQGNAFYSTPSFLPDLIFYTVF
jgi:hypothetical protein